MNTLSNKNKTSMTYKTNRSNETYKTYLSNPEDFANCLIWLINQANYLLDKQLVALEKAFIEKGGYTENLFKRRIANKRRVG